MVNLCTPCLEVVLAVYTGCLVGLGVRNPAIVHAVAAGNTDTADTAGLEACVAVVVPQPVLHGLASLLGANVHREVGWREHPVVHGLEPLVIALHPTEVVVLAVLVTEK